MIYVEWLRARKRLVIFAVVLAVLTALGILVGELGVLHCDVRGSNRTCWATVGITAGPNDQSLRTMLHDSMQQSPGSIDPFLMFASVIAFIFTISLYTSLHAQRESLHLAFTKPLSRSQLALRIVGVDLGAIAAIYAFTALLELLFLAAFGGLNGIVAPHAGAIVAVGGILLLYGLVQAGTSWLIRGCGGVLAALWVAFFIVPPLAQTPYPSLNAAANALLKLDPLQYMSSSTNHVMYALTSDVGTYGAAALAAWGLGVAACALAIFAWNRVEV